MAVIITKRNKIPFGKTFVAVVLVPPCYLVGLADTRDL